MYFKHLQQVCLINARKSCFTCFSIADWKRGKWNNILLPQNLCDLFLIIFKITNNFLLKMIVSLYLSDNDWIYISLQTLLLSYSIVCRMISYELCLLASFSEAGDCDVSEPQLITDNSLGVSSLEGPWVSRPKTDQIARNHAGSFIMDVWIAAE